MFHRLRNERHNGDRDGLEQMVRARTQMIEPVKTNVSIIAEVEDKKRYEKVLIDKTCMTELLSGNVQTETGMLFCSLNRKHMKSNLLEMH